MTKPNAICWDLDGTLADVEHRRQYVRTKPKNWNAWNAGISADKPHFPVQMVYQALTLHPGYSSVNMILVSGREGTYREVTEKWLYDNSFAYHQLHMRKASDNRCDSIVKGEIADLISETHNIVMVFDDRPKVLRDCWQKRGIWTFDVGQGCEDF